MDGGTFNYMEQRDILFHGKRVDNGEWVDGFYVYKPNDACLHESNEKHMIIKYNFMDWNLSDMVTAIVFPESVGQYTGMNEFVVTDKSFNAPLFEGDIVEVWSRRRPWHEAMILYRDNPTSQYDIEYKVRAIIVFKNGEWQLDYDNAYNHFLEQLRGNEATERTVEAGRRLYGFGYHGSKEEWHREHNYRNKWSDIVKIGNIFDNPELLNL